MQDTHFYFQKTEDMQDIHLYFQGQKHDMKNTHLYFLSFMLFNEKMEFECN